MQEQCINYISIQPPLCRQFIDLDRFAAKSFQGWDCWGKGRPPGPPQ